MIKRIFLLTTLLLGGIMIGSLRGQQRGNNELTNPYEYEASKEEAVKQDEPQHDPCAHQGKEMIKFYRLRLDGNKGMWHMYNEEDKHFLDDVQRRLKAGQYDGKIEWFELPGRLPQ